MDDAVWDAYTVVAAALCASFGMLVGDRWVPDTPLLRYLRTITAKPSACDGCSTAIRWPYLMPIVGYAASRGRCQCRLKRVSAAYPIGESLAAAFMAAMLFSHGIAAATLLPAIAGAAAAFRSDMRHQEIHEVHLALVSIGMLAFWWITGAPTEDLETGALLGGLLLAINVAARWEGRLDCVPYVDSVLVAALGLGCDFDQGITFMAALAALTIAAYRMRGTEALELPHGPPLVIAGALAMALPPLRIHFF